MPTIFSRIVSGEIPAYKVAEDKDYLAFLDINPLKEGHTLVIPKREVDYIFDLDPELQSGLWVFASSVAKGIQKVIPCRRIGVTVIGLEVPHAHVHLIPLTGMHDMDFSKPKLTPAPHRMEELAAQIREAINMP
jgi:histidine triad (HIT) family protein